MVVAAVLAGCGAVDIEPRALPRPDLPQPQFTAITFWPSNDPSKPTELLADAAVRACRQSADPMSSALFSPAPYGVHGTWMLDFACARR